MNWPTHSYNNIAEQYNRTYITDTFSGTERQRHWYCDDPNRLLDDDIIHNNIEPQIQTSFRSITFQVGMPHDSEQDTKGRASLCDGVAFVYLAILSRVP